MFCPNWVHCGPSDLGPSPTHIKMGQLKPAATTPHEHGRMGGLGTRPRTYMYLRTPSSPTHDLTRHIVVCEARYGAHNHDEVARWPSNYHHPTLRSSACRRGTFHTVFLLLVCI